LSGFSRFTEILDTIPDVADSSGARSLDSVTGNVRFEGVRFGYETSPGVLEGIDLEIKAGTKCALVGPSGGGKTTLCSLLPRFYDVSAGRITIDGTDIRDLTLASLRSCIGLVQQDVYLFGGTIRENIAYGRGDATEEEIMEAAVNANIHDFIMSLPDAYDSFVGERGVRLSGGQKQRISIARVFLKNPPILVLDEATSSLDTESERFIQTSLDRLSEKRTTIVIAHRLSTVRNADEIVVIEGGKVRERGSHADLLAENGLYARLTQMDLE
jgi:ATP-binding cassette subfamily B protein